MLKKARRKNKTKIKIKIFAGIFILLFIFSSFLFLIGKILFLGPLFISPVGLKTNSQVFNLENMLRNSKIDFRKVTNASDSSYLVFLKDGGEVNISPKKNIKDQVSSLQLIISRLTIEGKRFKRLDFRFDKPIVIF